MHLQIAAYPFGIAVVIAAVAYTLRAHHRAEWAVPWLIFGVLLFGTIAVGPWLDALAGLISTTAGTITVFVLFAASGISFFFQVVLRHMHRPMRTHVIAGVFAVTLALFIADSARLIAVAAKSPGKTAQAFGHAVTSVQSGKAAAAVPAGHRLIIIGIGVLAVIGLYYTLHYASRMKGTPRQPLRKKGGRGGPQIALPPGGQQALSMGKGAGALARR